MYVCVCICRKGVVHYNAIMSLRTALDKLEQMKGLKSEEKGINRLHNMTRFTKNICIILNIFIKAWSKFPQKDS